MLREVDGRVGRYAFAHALVRATLYDGLSALRRARLHSRVGETILARHQDDLDPWLPAARPPLRPRRAGRRAGARHRLRARRRPPRRPPAGLGGGGRALPRRRMRARQATTAGDRTGGRAAAGARRVARSAPGSSRRARRSPRPRRARARARRPRRCSRARRSASPGRGRRWAREDPEVVAVLEEALQGLGEEDSPLRARLLARLSLELYYAGRARAADAAERGGGRRSPAGSATRRTLAAASTPATTRCGGPRTSRSASRSRASCGAIAAEHRGPRARARGRGLDGRGPARARRRRRRRHPDRGRARARRGRAPAAVPLVDVAVPLHARPARRATSTRAEQLAAETLAIGQRGHAENALHYYAMAMFNIRREQGRLGEVEDAVARFIEMYPAIPAWRCSPGADARRAGPRRRRRARRSRASRRPASTRCRATPTG